MICTVYAPWFGPLPFYAKHFLSCCAKAINIQWCIASDQPAPANLPKNIFWLVADESDLIKKVFSGAPRRVWRHKLCDLKPFWHDIFFDDRAISTMFRGWIDWDVYHDLSFLDFNFISAKFTKSDLCSPLFITRCNASFIFYPCNLNVILNSRPSVAWDEDVYLKKIKSSILQEGMTPEIDLIGRAEFAVHMYRAKNCPLLYEKWVKKYFKNM